MKHLRLALPFAALLVLAACGKGEEDAAPAPTAQASLTVSRIGQGQVQSTPAGIDCGADCSQAFDSGTQVTLSAAPASGYAFAGWSGSAVNCSGTADCAVTVETSKSVTATFSQQTGTRFNLAVTIAGGGTVSADVGTLSCATASDCIGNYAANTAVTLTAQPATGYAFSGWSGSGLACTGSSCTVQMSSARSVTATFTALPVPSFALNVTLSGSGSVSSAPAGISCGSDCSENYPQGSSVTLSAAPASGFSFSGWSGAGCTGTGSCKVTLSSAQTVSASFAPTPASMAAINVNVSGSGTVQSAPSGINCPGDCAEMLPMGTQVTLTAKAAAKQRFAGWTNTSACTGTAETCKVTLSSSTAVNATFQTITYTLTASKTGSGSIKAASGALDCGATCSATYDSGATTVLTATAADGFQFAGWGDACAASGTVPTCSVTMGASQKVSATFTERPKLTLTVTTSGSGTVAITTPATACGTSCSPSFASGTVVTLAATPASGASFSGWSGACSGVGACTVTMAQAAAVTATFTSSTPSDTTPPTVSSTSPAAGATSVAITSPASVTFSEAVNCSTVTSASLSINGVAGAVSCSGSNAVFTPSAALAYGTTYTAQLGTAVKDVTGNALAAAKSWTFTTGAAPVAGGAFTFMAYGDSRSGNGCDGNVAHMALVSRMVAEPASFVFNLGDMITGYDKSTNWLQRGDCPSDASKGSFKEIIAPLQTKTPAAGLPVFYYPVVGNHDDNFGDGWYPDKFGDGFCSVFDPKQLVPNHTQSKAYFKDWTTASVKHYSDAEFYTAACAKTRNGVYPDFMYYSFDYKNTHFVVLRVNSDYYDLMECSSNCTAANEGNYDAYYYKHQLDWLRYDLAKNAANTAIQNTVVLMHAPVISYSDGHAPVASWPTLVKEFSKYKVKMVISGHSHVYERSVPVYADDANPNGVRDDAKGTVYVVTGGGGSALAGFKTLGPLNAKATAAHHYMRLDVNGSTVSVKVTGKDGTVLDSFSR